MKIRKYEVYHAGSTTTGTIISETCITKAIKRFSQTLSRPAKYFLYNKSVAAIRYADNHSIDSDFVVLEK